MRSLIIGARFGAAAVVAGGLVAAAQAQTIQTGTAQVRLQLVAEGLGTNFTSPNFGAHTGDPRFMFVGQQDGVIRTLDFSQPNPLLPGNFLDIASVVPTMHSPSPGFDERGLLGGAFHPDFSTPGTPGFRKFYTYTSESIVTPVDFTHPEIGDSGNHQSVVREWTAGAPDPNGVFTIDTSVPSRVLMRINEPQFNHNGGAIAFGPDRYMYIALGDGGGGNDRSPNNASGTTSTTDGHTNPGNPDIPGSFMGHGNGQDRTNIYGTIVRIKPTTDADPMTSPSANGQYRIPNDNPFTAQPALLDEIYAYGLRNPFRISFDKATGTLYAADVGQVTREEINVIVNGGNYGWVAREGFIQNPAFPLDDFPDYVAPPGEPFIDPIADYPRGAGGGLAVMGGFVYRGSLLPELEGKYVFGDWNRDGIDGGGMMYMDIVDPGMNQVFDLVIVGDVMKPGFNLHGIAEDVHGELYYLFANGQIMKLVPEPSSLALVGLATVFALRPRRRSGR